jgi:tetratricopeptide (TPR) repeat protein
MASTALPVSVGLPLARRLRRAVLIALLLGLWAPVKIMWEQEIGHEQDLLRYHGVPMTRQLRDELGQGLTIGVLSGMRSVVADLLWLNVEVEWENQEWFKMGGYINLCTALQPRAPVFWDSGGWQLAWNASVATMQDTRRQPNDLRRIKASRFWVQRGLEIFKRGIENNPEYWHLWADTGLLYDQRLKDYPAAAYYYGKAIMYDSRHANDPQAEYVLWKALWQRLTPQQMAMRAHTRDRLEVEIRRLEKQLSIPNDKRIFPN